MPWVAQQEKAIIEEDGSVLLPEWLRTAGGFEAGDELQIWWLPPDQIVARRVPHWDEQALNEAMREFREALQTAGYDTEDEIVQLVREVKRDQAQEWSGR